MNPYLLINIPLEWKPALDDGIIYELARLSSVPVRIHGAVGYAALNIFTILLESFPAPRELMESLDPLEDIGRLSIDNLFKHPYAMLDFAEQWLSTGKLNLDDLGAEYSEWNKMDEPFNIIKCSKYLPEDIKDAYSRLKTLTSYIYFLLLNINEQGNEQGKVGADRVGTGSHTMRMGGLRMGAEDMWRIAISADILNDQEEKWQFFEAGWMIINKYVHLNEETVIELITTPCYTNQLL